MGQPAHQHPGDLLLGQLGLFLGDAQQAIPGQQLKQNPAALQRLHRGDRIVGNQALAVAQVQLRLALGEGMPVADGVAQGLQ